MQRNFVQRDVEITVMDCGRKGGFLSNVTIISRKGEVTDVAETLVGKGLSEIVPAMTRNGALPDALIALQKQAQDARLGIWADRTLVERNLSVQRAEVVWVISVWSPVRLTVQFRGPEIERIEEILSKTRLSPHLRIKRDESVCVRVNEKSLRARVIDEAGEGDEIRVELLDFKDLMKVKVNQVFDMPEELRKIEPQGKTVRLGCVSLPKQRVNVKRWCDRLWEVVKGTVSYLHVMYEEEEPCVLLTDKEDFAAAGSLNAWLVAQGICVYTEHPVPEAFASVVAQWRDIGQKDARTE
jgi:hypothetical protein